VAQSDLLLHPQKNSDGRLHKVTPASARWKYVGLEVVKIPAGRTYAVKNPGNECCVVVQSGEVRVTSAGFDSGPIGARADVFSGLAWSVYLPPGGELSVEAVSDAEVALCFAPAVGKFPARVMPPESVETLTRGKGTNTRHVRNILPETAEAESLLVVEVITPGGNWSSYPPHKHDRDMLPEETLLEETYYHRINPSQGFAMQRVYTDDHSLDETMTIHDRDVVLVPRGYHPVSAAHGYDLFYLNVMAGPKKMWRFHNEPAHAWLLK